MATDLFSSLLQELSAVLKSGPFNPDSNNSCLLKLPNGMHVQIEPDRKGPYIILGTDLGEVPPPGKYRKELFRAALIHNGLPEPKEGQFAYSKQSNHLVFFKSLPIENLTGEKIAEHLAPLAEKGLIWKEALSRGDVPFLSITGSPPSFGGLFGLIG